MAVNRALSAIGRQSSSNGESQFPVQSSSSSTNLYRTVDERNAPRNRLYDGVADTFGLVATSTGKIAISRSTEPCASRWLMRDAERRGHVHQVGKGACFHLPHNLASVCLHRDLADAEFEGDLLVQSPVTTSAMTSCSRRLSDA